MIPWRRTLVKVLYPFRARRDRKKAQRARNKSIHKKKVEAFRKTLTNNIQKRCRYQLLSRSNRTQLSKNLKKSLQKVQRFQLNR